MIKFELSFKGFRALAIPSTLGDCDVEKKGEGPPSEPRLLR